MGPLEVLVLAIWVMLPAYIPNNIAVLAGGGRPVDGGRVWRDRRILGDGKTWRGTVVGIVAGVAAAGLLNLLQPSATELFGMSLPAFSVAIAVAFPIGALLGDMTASFLKRRTGRERGAPFPLVDQLDFLIMALLIGVIADFAWMITVFSPVLLVVIFVLTPVLHVATNVIAYLLGVKSEPW